MVLYFYLDIHTYHALENFKLEKCTVILGRSASRDNNPQTSFALLTDNKFEIVRLDYDYEPLFNEMKKHGIDDYYYGCLKYGSPRLRKP